MKYALIFSLAISMVHAEGSIGRTYLALVGFTEARSESDECMSEAMHVVLERLKTPERWGLSIEDIVLAKDQFIGVQELPYPRRPPNIEPTQWQRALAMADKVIAGTAPREPKCAGAVYFDQGGGAGKEVLCRCGNHTFSRDRVNVEMVRK